MPRDDAGQISKASIVDENDVEESLEYLRTTAEPAARLKARAIAGDLKLKQARAAAALASTERSADRREADAWASNTVDRVVKDIEEAEYQAQCLFHSRRFHELRIEVWRSLNASRRVGAI